VRISLSLECGDKKREAQPLRLPDEIIYEKGTRRSMMALCVQLRVAAVSAVLVFPALR
jgi:hypothetical protein